MKRKHIMQIDPIIDVNPIAYRVVIVTLDSHSAGPCDRAASKLIKDFPLFFSTWSGCLFRRLHDPSFKVGACIKT